MVENNDVKDDVICVIGLGYVGLPLAETFSKKYNVIGFDINTEKIHELKKQYNGFHITSDASEIQKADVVIITVPTPVSKSKQPDLSFIESAVRIIGKNLKKGAIVVLESTVYPSITNDVVGVLLEKESGLVLGKDFKIGYSPERVNPGDSDHTIDKVTKIVSGMDEETTDKLVEIYGSITEVFRVKDIQTAEAAKVIENIQRDLNIALINEFSLIFDKMGLDTKEVLDAAATKWNFHRYSPGLVGGHCIPVDPYYLVYKAKELDYHPQVILSGRSVNDNMSKYVVQKTVKAINKAGKIINGSNILILGLTFKENVSDTRETPIRKVICGLKEFHCNIYGYDPLLSFEEIKQFGITPIANLSNMVFNCIIISVIHDEFKEITLDALKHIMDDTPILIDLKRMFKRDEVERQKIIYSTL